MTDHVGRAPRKNLFLAASIEAGSLKAQVRIRNMSQSGAMIDGPVLPSTSSPLILRRGDIEIGGIVVWSHAGRCGVRFEGVIQVEEWVAGRRLPERDKSPTGQQRVDAIQAAIRLGRPVAMFSEEGRSPPGPEASSSAGDLNCRIGQEIAAIQRTLVAATDELSDNPLMLARYGSQLQALQSASEVLDHLARILQTPNGEAAAADISLHALRARLLGKSLF